MIIDFENPVLPVDKYAQRAFLEILNLVLLSDNVYELGQRLKLKEYGREYHRLSGYFKWSYARYSFTLWQRMEYQSPLCFRHKILEVKHITFITQGRIRPGTDKN